ncbi:MAG TPA: tRNA (guanosine(37)-N1)-methyltransferase TrmD [bacterium]|nr:tRNA (guanosine(37)-N1)-methyltransferase TrmD [bacterium]
MKIDILTIFPQMFDSPFADSIIKRARQKGIVEIETHDIREHSKDKHRSVDDSPYGGGAGMVMMAGPLVEAVEGISRGKNSQCILLAPQGEPFTQKLARELSQLDQIILICGRYEGIDQRAIDLVVEREISIGDYILSGGEIPAMVIADSVIRLLPGALGNEASAELESFESGLLEHPHYTRPEVFRGIAVPKVLLSGNHADIERWRHEESLRRTSERRPDLIAKFECRETFSGTSKKHPS